MSNIKVTGSDGVLSSEISTWLSLDCLSARLDVFQYTASIFHAVMLQNLSNELRSNKPTNFVSYYSVDSASLFFPGHQILAACVIKLLL